MIKVLFFAQIRELTGVDQLELAFTPQMTANDLRQNLAARGDKWLLALAQDNLLVAVNQTLGGWDVALQDGDEIAFFPPVTGG